MASSSRRAAEKRVSTRPGATAFTRMPREASSTARVRVSEITAALLMP